jgi:hypothetical protein
LLAACAISLTDAHAASYPPNTTMSTLSAVPTAPALPAYRTPISEPNGFGTTITRITDQTAFNSTSTSIRHHYAKNQAWNFDGTRAMLTSSGNPLLDGNTYEIVRSSNTFTPSFTRWSSVDPNVLYKIDAGNEWRKITISPSTTTQTTTVEYTFTGFKGMNIGPSEGNISIGDQYVALAANKTSGSPNGDSDLWVVIYDIQNEVIKSVTPFYNRDADLDWVSMSQSGNYVVFRWKGANPGVEVYTLPATNGDPLVFGRQLTPSGSHGDLGYDSAGYEVWVAAEYDTTNYPTVAISTYRLDNAQQTTQLLSGGAGSPFRPGHVSCRNYKRPGWAYITTMKASTASPPNPAQTCKEVFALKLDGSGTVQRFGWTYNNYISGHYPSESQGVPNPDGTKVMFGSNWGGTSTSDIVYSYVAEWAQTPSSNTYQAENATLSGAVIESNYTGYNGTGFVNYGTTGSVQFTGVAGLGGGGKILTIRYSNGGTATRTGQVVVNGGSPVTINQPVTGSWSTWANLVLPITLNNNSTNTITVSSTGSDLGNIDQITVTNGQPVFTTQPSSQTVNAGSNVSFTVAATGSPTPTYQWQKNGVNISGATSATLSLSSVQASNAGSYVAIATNSSGVTSSNAATLTVNSSPPAITTQPSGQTVTAGANVTLSVVATGSPTLTYQWKRNGTNVSGGTSSTLSLNNIQPSTGGTYSVVVTNSAGSVTSNNAVVVVNVPPSITTQPSGQTVTAGANVTLSVVATGSPAPTYQWKRNGTNVSGGTSSTLSLNNIQPSTGGTYSVVVTNSAGSVTSNNAVVVVNVLTYQAEDATLSGGSVAESNNAGYNGTGFVNSSTTGGSILFTNVNGQGGGSKTLVIRYALGKPDRTGQLVVNGGTPVSLTTPDTGAFTTWVTMNVPITLNNNSTNTIAINTNGNDLGNIDEITIQ